MSESASFQRVISTHRVLRPFGLGLLVEVSTSRPGSLSGLRLGRRGSREGREAKVFCAVRAKHDSIGHLLESRSAATTTEVFEALRERASGSVEDADVIERGGLADFAAPFDSLLSSATHDKLGESHSLLYSQVGRFGGKSTGVLSGLGRPGIGPSRVYATTPVTFNISQPFSFASERLPCGKRVHVISPENNLSILDGDDGRESVVIRSARFDGFAMNLIFQSDHAAFLVMVNRKTITFLKNDVVAVARVGGNQIFSPVNHFRPTGEAV